MIYNLKLLLPFAADIVEAKFINNKSGLTNNFVNVYLPALMTLGIVALFYLIINQMGLIQKHKEFVDNQRLRFRVILFHQILNLLVIPLLSISVSSDLFKVAQQAVNWQRYKTSFLLTGACTVYFISARFYITIMAQYASLGFMTRMLRLTSLLLKCFKFDSLLKSAYKWRTRKIKFERCIYKYGHYLAWMITIITITSTFG